jgi:hypothetical protein
MDRNADTPRVADRIAHNPKVTGSNPVPATNKIKRLHSCGRFDLCAVPIVCPFRAQTVPNAEKGGANTSAVLTFGRFLTIGRSPNGRLGIANS